MTGLTIVGGVYRERCIQPLWDAVFGSAGRALQAAAPLLSGRSKLVSYVTGSMRSSAQSIADAAQADFEPHECESQISFSYLHPLATPKIYPAIGAIKIHDPMMVRGDVVLRYGMLEGDAIVDADVAIYDPQSAFDVIPFAANGSRAGRLALVLNGYEARSLSGQADPRDAARWLLREQKAEVVVIKMGAAGALVVTTRGDAQVPLYRTERVWKIGSGDVFSSTFAALWGCRSFEPDQAADYASRATASYCNTRALPVPDLDELTRTMNDPVEPGAGRIYLAGPFFDLAQRWLVEEARSDFLSMGAQVFSPVHEVGPGPAALVAPADLDGLNKCQVVFAILNGLDPGTIFEVGYAVQKGTPVVALAQNLKDEDLKMVAGTGCEIVDDYTSAVYRTLWRLPAV
jgi:hypothetical protein